MLAAMAHARTLSSLSSISISHTTDASMGHETTRRAAVTHTSFRTTVARRQVVLIRLYYDGTHRRCATPGKSMEYYDEVSKEKYIPHVIEPSIGVDRLFLATLCSAYVPNRTHRKL